MCVSEAKRKNEMLRNETGKEIEWRLFQQL